MAENGENDEVEKLVVLVVEDNPDDIELLRLHLRSAGPFVFSLVPAESLSRARRELAERRFDLIFLDYHVGVEDGSELLRELRAAGRTDAAIILTGQGDEYTAARLGREGADDYVAKRDAHGDVLRRAVTNALALGRLREARSRLAETERLQAVNRELSAFAAVVSHDLQAPLRTVEYFLHSVYSDPGLAKHAKESLEFALSGVTRMSSLCRDLLAFCQLGTAERMLGTVDLGEVVAEALANLHAAIEESSAVLEVDALPKVAGERTRLVQLFQNLIGNALKFRNSAAPWIHICVRDVDGMQEISVEDNGIGIAPEDADRVFGAFERAATADARPGSGLGLAICRRIVTQHGGWICVVPRDPPGTTISFTLPTPESWSAPARQEASERSPLGRV